VRGYLYISALVLLFQPFVTIDLWFQSQVQSKLAVTARTTAFVLVSSSYFLLILLKQPLSAFIWVPILEAFLVAAGYGIVYKMSGESFRKWNFQFQRAKTLLGKSWFLMLSSIGTIINLKVDQIMLKNMVSASELGVYSSAVRISEVWYFLPSFIALSIFPALIRSRSQNNQLYTDRLQKLLDVMLWIGISIAVAVTFTSDFLILFLFDTAYIQASPILSIHIWAGIFIFMGEILSKWIINEDFLVFSPIRHGAGAVMNIGMNLVLIPELGGLGAAISTVVSYATASYLICFLHPKSRPIGVMMTRAFTAPIRIFRSGLRGYMNL
jgi:PST family polysaccharide transporter